MVGLIRPPCLAIALATAGQRIRSKGIFSASGPRGGVLERPTGAGEKNKTSLPPSMTWTIQLNGKVYGINEKG